MNFSVREREPVIFPETVISAPIAPASIIFLSMMLTIWRCFVPRSRLDAICFATTFASSEGCATDLTSI